MAESAASAAAAAVVAVLVVVVDMAFVASVASEVYMELEYCYQNNLELVLVAWNCMVVVLVMEYIQHDLVVNHHHRIEMLSF